MSVTTSANLMASPRSRWWVRPLGFVVVYYIVIKPILIVVFFIPGPWGPPVTGRLPTGERVTFYSRRHGRETDEHLVVDRGDNDARTYIVNQTHALLLVYVEIKYA